MDLTQFHCQRCGACCRWPGEVRLSPEEQDAIAIALQLDIAVFLERYTRLAANRKGLALLDNELGHCIFYDAEAGCRIHHVKPQQCRDFPYRWSNPGWEQLCAGAGKLQESDDDSVSDPLPGGREP